MCRRNCPYKNHHYCNHKKIDDKTCIVCVNDNIHRLYNISREISRKLKEEKDNWFKFSL